MPLCSNCGCKLIYGKNWTNTKTHRTKKCTDCEYIYQQKYRKSHPEKDKRYAQSLNGKYTRYKARAKFKNISFHLSKLEFKQIVTQPCYYCGKLEKHGNGIDRVDSNKGYFIDNAVPCCFYCNAMKSNKSKDEFIKQCKLIVAKQELMGNDISLFSDMFPNTV